MPSETGVYLLHRTAALQNCLLCGRLLSRLPPSHPQRVSAKARHSHLCVCVDLQHLSQHCIVLLGLQLLREQSASLLSGALLTLQLLHLRAETTAGQAGLSARKSQRNRPLSSARLWQSLRPTRTWHPRSDPEGSVQEAHSQVSLSERPRHVPAGSTYPVHVHVVRLHVLFVFK
jgi:hypothetical protein